MSDSPSAADPQRWNVPSIDGSDGPSYLTAGRLQELQKEAYDEAFEKGKAAGEKAGEDIIALRAERLNQLLHALCEPFEELDESVETQLVELAMVVVKQLFRRELRLEPTHIIGVVREAIQMLPIASRTVQVHLHPDDAALIRDTLSPAEGEPAWTIVEDPLSSRGGCRVTTDNSQIDASAESRLAAVINKIMGDDRG